MENADEALKILSSTLEKYRMNKTKVPAADLAGKYRVPFQKLKQKLRDDIEAYLKAYSLSGIMIMKGDLESITAEINRSFREREIGERAGRAAFQDYNLAEIQKIAGECRRIFQDVYARYFNQHTGLCLEAGCFDEDRPVIPRVYNEIVDKFWDDGAGRWIERRAKNGKNEN